MRNGPIEIQTIEGDVLTITKDTADKARDRNISENGNTRKLSDREFLVKLHAESHIDELAEISRRTNQPIAPDLKNHEFAKDGFSYRTVYFQDFDGSYYRITLSIGENNGVSTVYNVGKIKTEDIPNGNIVSAIGSKADMSSASFSIPESPQNVKQNVDDDLSFSVPSADSLLDRYEKGEITREEYLERINKGWQDKAVEYGTMRSGKISRCQSTMKICDAGADISNNLFTLNSFYV